MEKSISRTLVPLTIIFFLTVLPAAAEPDSVKNLANFQDSWGNTGGLYRVLFQDKPYLVFKLRERSKPEEADILLDQKSLAAFEANLIAFQRANNPLREEGFQVFERFEKDGAILQEVFVHTGGVPMKAIQVVQERDGTKREHAVALDNTSYQEILRALRLAKQKMGW